MFETIAQATEARIEFDGWNDEGDNAFFCAERGFTLIDYSYRKSICLADNIRFALRSLGTVGIELANREGYKI